jgi:hypothetical protein
VAANVVILFAEHRNTDIIESRWQGVTSYSLDINLRSEGAAIVVRDGRQYDGRWVRVSRETIIQLLTPEGHPLYLKPGNTWFQVVKLPQQMTASQEWVRIE